MGDIFDDYLKISKETAKPINESYNSVDRLGNIPTDEDAKRMFGPFTLVVDEINSIIENALNKSKKIMPFGHSLATVSSALAFVVASWVIYMKKNTEHTDPKEFMAKFTQLTLDGIKAIESKEDKDD